MGSVNGSRIGAGITVNGIAPLWPVDNGIRRVSPRPFGGYLAERQSRFYFRGLRRDGLYFEDVPLVVLWTDNFWDAGDIWLI